MALPPAAPRRPLPWVLQLEHLLFGLRFENVESARLYLAVFEKTYRFTPFSDDAQERIRAKCPLELAGYPVHELPMTRLFRGLALQWPSSAFQELVPNE